MTAEKFLAAINQRRRSKLAAYIKANGIHECFPLARPCGSFEKRPSDDKGVLVLVQDRRHDDKIIVITDIVKLEYDDAGKLVDVDEAMYIEEQSAEGIAAMAKALVKFSPIQDIWLHDDLQYYATQQSADGEGDKSFAGWKGGRPKRVLSKEEQNQIKSMRVDGASVNSIAKTLKISNRVIADFVKSI